MPASCPHGGRQPPRTDVAFQLHIRENLQSASDHFGPGQVQRFDAETVRVGAAPDCECRMADASTFAPCHLVIRRSAGRPDRVTVCPQEGAPAFLNGQPLTARAPLRSGDELRVGHWTLRFQRIHERVGVSVAFGLMSGFARVAAVLLIVAEAGVLFWLPGYMTRTTAWDSQVARHRVSDLLDSLRRRNRDSRDAAEFERALRRGIDREVQARASYMAQYGDRLNSARQQQIDDELRGFDRLLEALSQGTLPPPLPAIDLDAGVRAVLGQAPRR